MDKTMESILDTVKQRQQEAKQIKKSGILDSIEGKKEDNDSELAEIEGFSFNVAWHFEGENRRQAEQRMNELEEDAGYAIDYSNME